MASRVCWNCGQASHQKAVGNAVYSRQRQRYYLLFQCDECGVASIGSGDATRSSVATETLDQSTSLEWLPARYAGKDFPDVPQHIASAASEAYTCHSAQAYRAAIVLSRAVVEATAKDQGITTGTLASKIQMLYDKGHVRELIKDTADEIRYIGNDMAHGDFVDPITNDDAQDVLAFMAEVLEEVYQAPARVNARRKERLARKVRVGGSTAP